MLQVSLTKAMLKSAQAPSRSVVLMSRQRKRTLSSLWRPSEYSALLSQAILRDLTGLCPKEEAVRLLSFGKTAEVRGQRG